MKRIISLLICTILLFCGCSQGKNENIKSGTGKKITPENGGTVKMACVPVDTLNPLVTKHASISDFLSLVYEGLFSAQTDLTAKPVLAQKCTASQTNTVYTVKLRKDVLFHNGKKFGSDDVLATFDYLANFGGQYADIMNYIASYSAPDSETVVINLNTPKSDFANVLDFPILPSGLTLGDFAPENLTFIPNGTGMYSYESSVAYKSINLKSNANWHGGESRAYIDNINIEILSDGETIFSAFDAGAIDVVSTSWKSWGDINFTSDMYNTFESEQNRFTFIGINCNNASFDTEEERRLLASYIDPEKINDDIMIGHGKTAHSPVRDNVYYNAPDIKNTSSGKKPDEKADTGVSKDITPGDVLLLYNSDNKLKERLANALKHQLERGGYTVSLDGETFDAYSSKVLNGSYELYIGEVKMENDGDLSFMFGENRDASSLCNYHDSELYTLIANISSMSDKDEKTIAWENAEKYYKEKAFQIPLYFTNDAVFVNKRIQGSVKGSLSNLFEGFSELFIKTENE